MMKKTLLLLFVLFNFCALFAQDDLMKELESVSSKKKERASAAFKAIQICTMQSTKMAAKGEYYVLIAHRFGDLTNGLDNFFGLDNALAKIGGLYGATDWLTVGISRQTYNKIFEFSAKYKLANQEIDGFPFTIVGFNTLDINSELKTTLYPALKFSNRLAFSTQIPISHKFNELFSLQINPIFIHKNLYDDATENKNQFLLGFGGRYKLTKRLSFNAEYAKKINSVSNTLYTDPLTIGLDVETGGHVFQLVFSNSQPMNDVSYFTNGTGNWTSKGIYFGFNMYRVFN